MGAVLGEQPAKGAIATDSEAQPGTPQAREEAAAAADGSGGDEPQGIGGATAASSGGICPREAFLCPITKALLQDPVIAADGHTYERAAIEGWLADYDTSPVTRAILLSRALTPNLAVRAALAEWRARAGLAAPAAAVAAAPPLLVLPMGGEGDGQGELESRTRGLIALARQAASSKEAAMALLRDERYVMVRLVEALGVEAAAADASAALAAMLAPLHNYNGHTLDEEASEELRFVAAAADTVLPLLAGALKREASFAGAAEVLAQLAHCVGQRRVAAAVAAAGALGGLHAALSNAGPVSAAAAIKLLTIITGDCGGVDAAAVVAAAAALLHGDSSGDDACCQLFRWLNYLPSPDKGGQGGAVLKAAVACDEFLAAVAEGLTNKFTAARAAELLDRMGSGGEAACQRIVGTPGLLPRLAALLFEDPDGAAARSAYCAVLCTVRKLVNGVPAAHAAFDCEILWEGLVAALAGAHYLTAVYAIRSLTAARAMAGSGSWVQQLLGLGTELLPALAAWRTCIQEWSSGPATVRVLTHIAIGLRKTWETCGIQRLAESKGFMDGLLRNLADDDALDLVAAMSWSDGACSILTAEPEVVSRFAGAVASPDCKPAWLHGLFNLLQSCSADVAKAIAATPGLMARVVALLGGKDTVLLAAMTLQRMAERCAATVAAETAKALQHPSGC